MAYTPVNHSYSAPTLEDDSADHYSPSVLHGLFVHDDQHEDSNDSRLASQKGATHLTRSISGSSDEITQVPRHSLENESRQGQEEKEVLAKAKPPAKPLAPLRYRRRTFWLLFFYIPLLIIPWTLTCVLAVRPFNKSSYYIQWGGITPMEILSVISWVGAIKVLNTIASVVTIPIMSTLLAQAAVVYCQRRTASQALNLRQVFALADRGWTDIQILWGSWGSDQLGTSSRFLWLAALLVFISAIQQPIQSGLVANDIVTVMTCIDEPWFSCDPMHFPIAVAYDPEPGDMSLLPQNILVQEVANQLTTFNEMDVQPHLWTDHPYVDPDLVDSFSDPAWRKTFFWNFMDNMGSNDGITRDFFATVLDNGTTTGVLREHATRFNSSVECNLVPQSHFPRNCDGARPFETSYSHPGFLELSICVPGEYGVSPWTLSRNRQDIKEELFLDLSVVPTSDFEAIDLSTSNFTMHCTAQTTRGYFEIGNYRNNYTYGPLVDKWPDPHEMAYEWNDHLNSWAYFAKPSSNDSSDGLQSNGLLNWGTYPPDPFDTYGLIASGPLMTSAIAMFGNESFFYIARNSSESTYPPALVQICQKNTIPFSRLGLLMFDDFQSACSDIASTNRWSTPDREDLSRFLWNWFANFQQTASANEALMASMFLANQAVLTVTSAATSTFGARPIVTAPGMQVIRPAMGLPAKIIVSVLIFLQLVGIALVVRYIYKLPTWTPAMDSIAVARIGKSMDDKDLPPIGAVSDKDRMKLTKINGLVGVVEEDTLADEGIHEEAQSSSNAGAAPPFRLGLGAPGLIHRGLAPRKLSKKPKRRLKWLRREKRTSESIA